MFGGYPYTAAALLALWPLFTALWRGVIPCSVACRFRCQLAAALVPLWPCRRLSHAPAGRSRGLRRLLRRAWPSAKVAGEVAKVAGIVVRLRAKVAAKVAVKVASACAKVAHFTPKS